MGQERLGPSYFFIPLVLGPLNSLVRYVPSLRYTRGLGWRIHCGVEITESSTNKQHIIGWCGGGGAAFYGITTRCLGIDQGEGTGAVERAEECMIPLVLVLNERHLRVWLQSEASTVTCTASSRPCDLVRRFVWRCYWALCVCVLVVYF